MKENLVMQIPTRLCLESMQIQNDFEWLAVTQKNLQELDACKGIRTLWYLCAVV